VIHILKILEEQMKEMNLMTKQN